MPFEFKPFDAVPDVILIEPRVFKDDRGWFLESFKASDFAAHGVHHAFHQDNHSFSRGEGVLRGLHYQDPPFEQGKLVRCTRGRVFDVAVDLRQGSPTYLKWVSVELSDENHRVLWVPPGFAHGFQTLTDVTEVVYKVTKEYARDADRSIRWDDPEIGVQWPVKDPVLSAKDADAPFLADAVNPFRWEDAT